jgi:hypothetical protein
MPNTIDVKPNIGFLRCFVLGDYGSGKSVFASTFPTTGFLFDTGNEYVTYRGKDFDYEQFSLSSAGWVKFESDLRKLTESAKNGDFKYKTVVLDNTTSLTDMAMERALQLDPKRSTTGGPMWNVHYQMVRNLLEGKLRQIVNLPANIVMIAHLKVVQDQESGAILSTEPSLTGQLATMVPGYFGEVYHAFVKNVEGKPQFFIRTITRGFYKARSRISGAERLLPDEVPNTYQDLMKALEKGLKDKETKDGSS